MSKESNSEVTVNDRRMFNPDGTLRQPVQEEESKPVTSQAESRPAPPSDEPAAAPADSSPEPARERPTGSSPEFSNLVGMLTTNAILHLGVDPQYGKGEVDIETARHFIEMLTVLKEKTEGNLSLEEEQLLTEMLGRLRMEYVSIVNQMTKSAKKKV